jgi:hypothetical protein
VHGTSCVLHHRNEVTIQRLSLELKKTQCLSLHALI